MILFEPLSRADEVQVKKFLLPHCFWLCSQTGEVNHIITGKQALRCLLLPSSLFSSSFTQFFEDLECFLVMHCNLAPSNCCDFTKCGLLSLAPVRLLDCLHVCVYLQDREQKSCFLLLQHTLPLIEEATSCCGFSRSFIVPCFMAGRSLC